MTDDLRTVDVFSGFGWLTALASIGEAEHGIDVDPDVGAVRDLLGASTTVADVLTLDPATFGPVDRLIASPPCTTYSTAGTQAGREVFEHVSALIDDYAHGDTATYHDHRSAAFVAIRRRLAAAWSDAGRVYSSDDLDDAAYELATTSLLVAEVARWTYVLRPAILICEQVPAVLELWHHIGRSLEQLGYRYIAAVQSSEEFGVAQTRARAFLVARNDGVLPQLPEPTHQPYRSGEARGAAPECHPSLFGPGRLPWVSMADALGEGMTERPYVTITAAKGGGRQGLAGGSGARQLVEAERAAGRWRIGFPRRDDTGDSEDGYRERDWREQDEPTFALTEKARSWTIDTGRAFGQRGDDARGQTRSGEEPAPAVTAKAPGQWILRDNQPHATERSIDQPAQTIPAAANNGSWAFQRPSTTLAADPRVGAPVHHRERTTPDAPGRTAGAVPLEDAGDDKPIKLTVDQALVLQSFPPGMLDGAPISKTAKFRLIGNAVAPLHARALLLANLPTPRKDPNP